MTRRIQFALVAAALVAVAGCSDSTPTSPTGNLAIEPETVSLQAGQSAQFTATDEAGNPVPGASWSSSNPRAITITPTGLATPGFETGTATITARAGSMTGQAEAVSNALCASALAVTGEPGTSPGDQVFTVGLDPKRDVGAVAQALADQFGFEISQMVDGGFEAVLTPNQVAALACRVEVVSIAYG